MKATNKINDVVLRRCAVLGAAAVVLFGTALFSSAGSADGPSYHQSTKNGYNYRFGAEKPWLPSQAQNASGEFMRPDAFPNAAYCGKCHQQAYKEWRESAHSNAFRAPFYKRNVDILIESKGIEFSRHCEGCHNPIALFTGVLTKDSKTKRWFDDEGLTCMTCHSIASIQNTSGTGSYVMGQPAVMLNPDGTPRPGLPSFDEILGNPEAHKKAVMKDIYKTSEFCGSCHKAAVPKSLNNYKWLRAFSVYDEWQNSSWARESALPFYKKEVVSTCQTCHMQAEPTTNDYGAKAGLLKSHRWLGANSAIPMFYGYTDQLKKLEAFLKNETLGMDMFALTKEDSGQMIAPLDRSDFVLANGDKVTLAIVIQNKGIGHSLVPEQRDFYESWVEFKVTDSDGKIISHSGYLEPNGLLEEKAHSYTNRLIGKDGKNLDRHQVWLTRTRAYDNTILPGRSDLVRYKFEIPADAKGPLSVTSRVNYRRFRQGWLDYALNKKGVSYPIISMVERTIKLNLGENTGTGPTAGQNDMLRWNNYGIALLGQQQYAGAAAAFQKVVEINPAYVDGYINIGVADYSYERYGNAKEPLEKALAMRPGDPRALYYKASIAKIEGRLDEAAELLKQVIAAFPRFRDAHRELGFTYYQLKKYELARQSYENLQSIDPDDLSAHYNLMLIYRRLGMKAKSAEQAAYFSDRKDDPGSGVHALDYLRANPQSTEESVSWHVHGVGKSEAKSKPSAGGSN